MNRFEITNIQKLYLMHLKTHEKENNITSVAKAFSCTKPNSKNILDNMIKEGFLYKEDTKYKLTKIGNEIATELESNRKEVEIFLNQGLHFELNHSERASYALIGSALDNFTEILVNKARVLNKFKKSRNINYNDIIKVFGYGKYKAMLSIQKHKEDRKESFVPLSMAMMGFEENTSLIIDDESYITLEAKVIKKPIQGYSKTGIVTNLSYLHKGEEINAQYNDKKFYLPLSVFKEWHLMGNTVLKSSACLNTSSKIGFSKIHKETADFTIVIDLLNLEI